MTVVKPAAEDLPARQPVWEALADMFLDTDTSLSRPWRVGELARSPYSVEQIECILIEEVYPVCKYNLFSVAGEWAGFDPQWLRARILRRSASALRFLHAGGLGRLRVRSFAEWQATKKALLAARGAVASGVLSQK